MIYYLYVKTHLETGLNYLGKTKNNPYSYKGSGIYWTRHLAIHGNNVWTNVIFQSSSNDEIKEVGLYYSTLWNVVESKDWANLKPESGEGGFIKDEPWNKGTKGKYSDEYLEKLRVSHLGQKNIMKGKKFDENFSKKVSEAKSLLWEITDPEGNVFTIKNLREFSRNNNLNAAHLVQIAKGTKSYYQHKGFKARLIT